MIIEQRDTNWWFKLNGATRYAIARGAFNSFAKPVVLTEYPKSGGTWMSQMLSATLEIPYPRNRLPLLSSQIIHGCYLDVNKSIDTVVMWRDGRDTMVSFYYHLMFDKPNTSARFSQRVKAELNIKNVDDVEHNLPAFIRWAFEGGYPRYSWADFVNTWKDREGIVTTSYEKVTEDPMRELKRVMIHFGHTQFGDDRLQQIVDDFSFEKQSSRKRGEEDVKSFIRKGIVGDWKNAFNKEAREVFDSYAGSELIELGYETDRDWINR